MSSYLVQLEGPVLESWKTAIVAEGADLQEYVPHFAFRARMSADAAARVRRLSFVSSVRPSNAADKQAPGLRRDGTRPYVVRIDRDADPQAVETALRAAGVQATRRGGSVFILAAGHQLDAIAGVDGVAAIANFAPRIKHNEYGGGTIVGSQAANANGYDGSTQTIAIADTGLGMGTPATGHADIAPARVLSIFNWPGVPDFCFETISNDGAMDVDSGHGTHVATAALGAGNAAGAGRGTAPAAGLVFQAIENHAVPSFFCSFLYGLFEGYYLVGLPEDLGDLFLQGYQAGARIHSNSWGAEVAGEYTVDSANADAFVWAHRDMAVTFSAGNSGADADADGEVDPFTINAPGTAKNVITVGASENDRQSHWECDPGLAYTSCAAQGGQNSIFTWGESWPDRYPVNPLRDDVSAGNAEQMAAFSSRGPTADGRIKPDVVAPGTWMLSGYSDAFQQQYDASPNPVNSLFQYDGWGFPADAAYKYMGGTSMSAPLVAGGAAVVRDFYQKSRSHQASAALVKAVLINSAVDLLDENNDGVLDNAQPIPNLHEGWGRVDLVNATDGSDQFDDETTPLSTGSAAAFTFPVTTPGLPFKVTLVWTDYPASTSAPISLVNDLDLTVTAPDGTAYKGNVFAGGWSAPGGVDDRLNNVENVYVFAAPVGAWTVTVTGYNVPNGPQPFALVVDSIPQTGLPIVRVTVDDATATEAGPTGGTVRFTRSGDPAAALDVTYTVSGLATAGADYVALSGTITIPEGASDATVSVDVLDDVVFEDPESVVITLVPAAAYSAGSPSSGTVTITSDDLPPDLVVLSMTAPDYAVAGASISVTDTTKNSGGGPAPTSETGYYLSLNNTVDPEDVFLGNRSVAALGVGAVETGSASIEIPASTAPATYRLLAKADWFGVVIESNESNNVRAGGYLRVGPDLLVSALTAPPTAAPGQLIQVTDTTKNAGVADAPATTTTFYLSTNTTLDGADQFLGARPVGALSGNGTEAASTPLTIPESTAVGAFYVLAQADSAGAVAEFIETNNVRASAVVRIGADLIISVLSAPAAAAAGETISVGETTKNNGSGDSSESTTAFYLSLNTSWDASDTFLASRAVSFLAAGDSEAATVPVTVPAATAIGTYYVLAKADAANEVAETYETNNVKSVKVTVGPDLIVTAIAAPTLGAAGEALTITDSTRNAAGGVAPATVTAFYLSTNTTLDANDVLLGTRAVPSLSAGDTSTETIQLVVPASTATGQYRVIAQADHAGAVTEVAENNNLKSSSNVGIGPDLSILVLTAPATVVRGTTMTVSDTTANGGGAAVGQTTTSYYLSVNGTLDAADLLLGSRVVGPLTAGASEAGQAPLPIPAGQAAGNYYLFAKSDPANAVSELNETNNTKVRTIKINP